jgi:NADH-quinone oxidoreductase subunit G
MVDRDDERASVEDVWGSGIPHERGRDGSAILEAAADRAVDVLFLIGVDVLRDTPDAALALRALQNAPFKVVIDTALGQDVAPFADVVLPASASIERHGTYTDWEGRSQRFVPVRTAFGMSRPDWQILQGLSEALGSDMGLRTVDAVRAEASSLLTPSRRGDRSEGEAEEPVAAAPDPAPSPPPGDGATRAQEGSLILFSYPLLVDEGRQLDGSDLLREALSRPAAVEVHPDDAARLALQDGGHATLRTSAGEATIPVQVTDAVAVGACFVPWNNPGLAANTLFSGTRRAAVTLSAAQGPAEAPAEGRAPAEVSG